MKKRFFAIFLMISFILILTGCGNKSFGSQADPDIKESDVEAPASETADSPQPFSHADPQDDSSDTDYVFPAAAPFIDDTGKSMQRDGNCLYSYYKGRLICFNQETEETALLYQTASTHRLNFCIHENDIYFVERTGYDSLDDRDTSLWRIKKDGNDLTLLQDDIINAGTMQDWTDYSIDIYDNVIYLINYTSEYEDGNYVTKTANLYYRLEKDDTVSEVEEAETLYGTLSERFSPVCDSDFPTFPYAMRNYGYIFMQDSAGTLYRMDPVSGARESLTIGTDDASYFAFSADLVFLYSYYGNASSLFSLSDKTFVAAEISLPESVSCLAIIPAEQSFYLCGSLWEEDLSQLVLLQILPDGSTETLLSDSRLAFEDAFYYAQNRKDSCVFDDHFYYYGSDETQYRLMRFPVRDNSSFQILDTWFTYPASSPAVIEVEENSYEHNIGNVSSVSCSTRKLFLEEKTAAGRQINQTLTEVYADFEAYVDGIIAEEQEQFEEEPDRYETFDYVSGYDFSLSVSLDYMDDGTISFGCSYYQYYAYAAHGYYWSDYYVFDRRTGKRLSFEDFAGDSATILNTARPYVEKAAGWKFDLDMLLDISRFSLSEDGYTLYFAPYDIDCYAAGAFLITIPYEAFEKKI